MVKDRLSGQREVERSKRKRAYRNWEKESPKDYWRWNSWKEIRVRKYRREEELMKEIKKEKPDIVVALMKGAKRIKGK